MRSIKNLLLLSSKQRLLCKHLEGGRGRLFRMAYAWCHDNDIADDVVQETMVKAMQSVDAVKDTEALDGWLFRVLSNCFIDYCRRQREQIDIEDIVLLANKTPESVNCQSEMLAWVKYGISSLPFKHRQVITLVDIESFSYAEVANILDIPQGTVMSRLNRARQALKKILQESKTVNEIMEHDTILKVVR